MILLDTDICIELLRGNHRVIDRRREYDNRVALCFMTVAELFYGAAKSVKKEQNNILVEKLLMTVEVINTDLEILKRFGLLKSQLEEQGKLLPDADILIAATSLIKCDKLVTGNVRHFARFSGLNVENWLK